MKKITRVLVANRGEIAVRIIRAARECGIESVAIFSEPDAGTLPVRLADKAIALGGATAKESYLDFNKIINAAIQTGCDAVHPGYGFLAENSQFAAAVTGAGLKFIGPTAEVILLMGDKHEARKIALGAKVPTVPGVDGGASAEEIASFAKKFGYPIIIKAVAGGSGRGMRVVENEAELRAKIGEASAEAESAFGNGRVFAERYLKNPRHIEIQVFGDTHGNYLTFGERECSLQRRHQKVVEEAPAARFHPTVRKKMYEAAKSLCRAVKYQGAGTLEFLVEDGEKKNSPFYFLEMNTRIQVEHTVTEEVFGVDLVKLQFHVANGEEIPQELHEIEPCGHAIQFRVAAENVSENFRPQSGVVRYLLRSGGPGVREDSWIEAGTAVSPYYDSLLSKLIVWAETREAALVRAKRALNDFVIEGLPTTLPFHRWVIEQQDFKESKVNVTWIAEHYHGEKVIGKAVGPVVLPEDEDER